MEKLKDRLRDQQINDFFIHGDLIGAMGYMKKCPELQTQLDKYIDIFQNEKYIIYDIPKKLNDILLVYQEYFRDIFYKLIKEEEAEAVLIYKLCKVLDFCDGDADEDVIQDSLNELFEKEGFHILCGKTNGHLGPYVWKETVPTTFSVELPDRTSQYTVNILKGFVFRSWLDYLTFGKIGTGGWTSEDGIINCIEKAYDFESESFKISLLKYEAQHSEDIKRWPGIKSSDLEYRAKLVELIYSKDTELLKYFIFGADENRTQDSHAIASARISKELGKYVSQPVLIIQQKAKELLEESTQEMQTIYC